MVQLILSPMCDFAFKSILGCPENGPILISFLQAVINLPPDEYESVTILNPVLTKETVTGKTGILDLVIKTKSGYLVHVEVQVNHQEYFPERMVYYSSRLITKQVGKGEHYNKIQRVISIVIAGYNILDDGSNYHHRYTLYDQDAKHEFPGRLLEIHVLELPKLPRRDDTTALWPWLRFFGAKNKGDLQMAAKREPQIAKACKVLVDLSASNLRRQRAESREMARMDAISRIDYYKRITEELKRDAEEQKRIAEEQKCKAEEQSRFAHEKGEQEKAMAIAKNALEKKYPIEDIAELTGLSVEEVLTLKQPRTRSLRTSTAKRRSGNKIRTSRR